MKLSKTIIIGAEFSNILLNFRILWLSGRFGGGKTTTAVILAAWLWWRGFVEDVVANFPCRIANPDPHPPLRSTAIVVDEAWQFARDSRAIERYAAFLRKLNNYLLLPSVFPLNARFQSFWVERVFNAYVIGLPLWLFRWTLSRPSYRERGLFAILNPHNAFPLFDSYAITASDGRIADLLSDTVALLAPDAAQEATPQPPKRARRASRSTSPHQAAASQPTLPGLDETSLALADAAAQVSEAADALADRFASIARRLRR